MEGGAIVESPMAPIGDSRRVSSLTTNGRRLAPSGFRVSERQEDPRIPRIEHQSKDDDDNSNNNDDLGNNEVEGTSGAQGQASS